jgi:hypothetical protein
MHSTTLQYRGYDIIVENYIYKLKLDPSKSFLTFDDIANHINNIESGFDSLLDKIKKPPNEK